MLLNIVETVEEMGKRAALVVAREMRKKKPFVLGLATGTTPLAMYNYLVQMHKEDGLDFSDVITFNLDEFVGLSADHPQSYHHYMEKNFFQHINIKSGNVHIPDGMAPEKESVGEEYEHEIAKAGGIDLQVVGVGGNGHIGFNEPGSSLGSLTRPKYLSKATRGNLVRRFGSINKVPKEVFTMGCGTILKSKMILIIATGERKADALQKALEGPITTMCPASVLQLHRKVITICTTDAASLLTLPSEEIPGI